MTGIVALVAAVLFGAASVFRLMTAAPTSLRKIAGGMALVAFVTGLAHGYAIGDTRWLVGAALMAAALVLTFANGRAAYILSLVLGDLGLILFVLALVTGYTPPGTI